MAASTVRAPLNWAWLLSMLLCGSSAQQMNDSAACTPPERLASQLTNVGHCLETQAINWSDNQTATLLDSLRTLTDVLHKHLKSGCKNSAADNCPLPLLHSKGGLVCVSFGSKRYCKPMCNEGHDFSMLRTSRLYEHCGADTRHQWTTQYVGGNRLALCNKSNVRISGAPTAYFPEGQDCLRTKGDRDLQTKVLRAFTDELRAQGVTGEPANECLLCG